MARQHGTLSCYKNGCRCSECRAANAEYNREYKRRTTRGHPTTPLVGADAARAHVRALQAAGMPTDRIAREARVPRAVIRGLLYGTPSRRLAPSGRIHGMHARRLQSVPVPAVPVDSPVIVDGEGPRRRVQALAALGWPVTWQARKIKVTPEELGRFVRANGGIASRTARKIHFLYAQYRSITPPPSRAAGIARAAARRRGWWPPGAWPDHLIDRPWGELGQRPATGGDWRAAAVCRGVDLALFFGTEGERSAERHLREDAAKQLCRLCPVVGACQDDALAHKTQWGVRGGLNPDELTAERRRRGRRANAA